METAVVCAFPELSSIVDGWRERTCIEDRPSMGIPPHVTLLYPFVPAEVAEGSLDGLRELFDAAPSFAVSFRELRRWPEMAYLAPEPPEPFTRLTEAIAGRWPAHPPYEGIHDVVIPHLTVAYGDDALLERSRGGCHAEAPDGGAVHRSRAAGRGRRRTLERALALPLAG